jgi:hypothetical protein
MRAIAAEAADSENALAADGVDTGAVAAQSIGLMLAAARRTSTSPACACGTGTSSSRITSGPPWAWMRTARML